MPPRAKGITAEKKEVRDRQLEWLRGILADKGWSAARLANEARIHPSTLVHFRTDKHDIALLEDTTIRKLCKAADCYPPSEGPVIDVPKYNGRTISNETDALELNVAPPWFEPDIFAHLVTNMTQLKPILLTSERLRGSGYLPGDILFVSDEQPKDEPSLVLATASFGERRLIRHFSRPLLYDNPLPPLITEVTVWDSSVDIIGTVVTIARGRRSEVPNLRGIIEFQKAMNSAR